MSDPVRQEDVSRDHRRIVDSDCTIGVGDSEVFAESTLNNCFTGRNTGGVYDRILNNMLQEHRLKLLRGQVGYGVGDSFKCLVGRDENGDIWRRIDGFDQARARESTHNAGEPCSSSGGGSVGWDGED